MSFLRDCFTVLFFFGVFAALLWHTIRVEFGFVFRDNVGVDVKPKAIQRKPSPQEVAAARRRLALTKE